MNRTDLSRWAGAVVALAAAGAWAQPAAFPSAVVRTAIDSGPLQNEAAAGGASLVRAEQVRVPHAPWLRLKLDRTVLSGDRGAGTGSYLLITSLRDGARQRLDARSLAEWSNTSGYFNGDAVLVELYAYAGTGPSRLSIPEVTAGASGMGPEPESICGTDDRVKSTEPGNARLLFQMGGTDTYGCTAWMITTGGCGNRFLTAGHCLNSFTTSGVVEFNVPDSKSNGGLNHPAVDDQYAVIIGSIQSEYFGVIGSDSAQFFTSPNSNTGLSAREGQGGAAYVLAPAAPPAVSQTVRATGYGSTQYTSLPLSLNQVQKTSTGPYTARSSNSISFRADITPGNSGGPVVLESTGEAIGVVTNSACSNPSYLANVGTAIDQSTLQSFLNSPIGPCDPYVSPFPIVMFYQPVQLWVPEPDPVIVNLLIIPGTQQIMPGSAMVHYRYSPAAAFLTAPLVHVGGFGYQAQLPPVACGDTPQLYFTAIGDGGTLITKPANAPEDVYTAQVGTLHSLITPLADFDAGPPPGWTMSGLWNIASALPCGDPDACQGTGFAYYGVQASCNYNTGGAHSGSVKSPSLPLPPPQPGSTLELLYCTALQSVQNFDAAQVFVNGVLVDTPGQFPVWATRTVNLDAFAGQNVVIEFRFSTPGPLPAGNPSGWRVDGIRLRRSVQTCEDCYPDCSGDGALTVADFGCFQGKYVLGDPYADCNASGILTVADFGCFQGKYVLGCR